MTGFFAMGKCLVRNDITRKETIKGLIVSKEMCEMHNQQLFEELFFKSLISNKN